MNKDESVTLYAQGRDAWNAWADRLLAERAALVAAGTWQAKKDFQGREDQNDITKAWISAAACDFSGLTLERADFSGFRFPGDAQFFMATFSGNAQFFMATFSADAEFREATFSADAGFDMATFSGNAGFDMATFSGNAWFREATFSADAGFDMATFSADAWFREATFSGNVQFFKATFSGNALFDMATFSENAGFDMATFSGNAGFRLAKFDGFTTFENGIFSRAAAFTAMRSESYFSLAQVTFADVPDFEQAHFAEAPRLDNSHFRRALVEPGRIWTRWIRRVKGQRNGDMTARWRALKRLAVQGHDHEREQMFFAEELKSLRGREDFALPRPWRLFTRNGHFWPNGSRYWFGRAYQTFSNFGRSMTRPLLWWATGILACASGYLSLHLSAAKRSFSTLPWVLEWFAGIVPAWVPWLGSISPNGPPALACLAGPGDAWSAALQLSVRKALLFAGLDSTDKLNQLYACLYGLFPAEKMKVGELPDQFTPVIPDTASVLGLAQLIYSAILLFLFLLAVRNHFRIR